MEKKEYYTFAEKLAIYVTPYVLKMNLTIIFYDFGYDSIIQRKFFTSNLPNKDTLYVLFRKAHYDICYTEEYFNSYLEYFNIHKNDLLRQILFQMKLKLSMSHKTYLFLSIHSCVWPMGLNSKRNVFDTG